VIPEMLRQMRAWASKPAEKHDVIIAFCVVIPLAVLGAIVLLGAL